MDGELERWYRSMAPAVKRYLVAVSGDPSLAEELTQETFFQVLRAWHRVEREHERAYLMGVARHVWAGYVRREQRRRGAEVQVLPPPDTVPLPFADGSDWLPALDPDDRVLLMARAVWGLPFREVAESLGRTENWARVRYFRILIRLRQEWDRQQAEGGEAPAR